MSTIDLLNLDGLLSAEEIELRERIKEFVNRRVRPNIATWVDDAYTPLELIPEMAELGVFGAHIQGYGCAGRSAVQYGLTMQELEAGDGSIRTIVSIHGSLAMSAIHKNGSDAQKDHWLPKMAKGEAIGAFALTEATAGSDPSTMNTTATLKDGHWVINGSKRWIGFGDSATIVVVWAKVSVADAIASGFQDEGDVRPGKDTVVRGFIVPTSSAGYSAEPIKRKGSVRASTQTNITLTNVEIPVDNVLPKNPGLRGPFSCLNEARYGVFWGAVGASRDSIEAALEYANGRMQFEKPISSYQLVQKKLVDMVVDHNKAALLALQLGRYKDQGKLELHQISLAKLDNTRIAINNAREARTLLGGNGISMDYSPIRHAANLEATRTYEGTDEVQTLVLGQHLTGQSAFR